MSSWRARSEKYGCVTAVRASRTASALSRMAPAASAAAVHRRTSSSEKAHRSSFAQPAYGSLASSSPSSRSSPRGDLVR